MASNERKNFYRNSTLIVDHAKDSLVDVLELHLTTKSLSFEDFINLHQHDIYHLCFNKKRCCQCSPGYILPHSRVLHPSQLEILLDKYGVTHACHVPGPADFCCCLAKPGVTTNALDITLARCLLINFCDDVFRRSSSLRNNIDTLLQMRNNVYGHAKEARITDVNYRIYKNEIGSAILEIAKVCGNETEKSQILMDLEKRSLDEALCIQYQTTLLEQIAKESQLEEKLDDLAEKMPEIVEKAVVKAVDDVTKRKLTKDQQIRKEKLKEITHNCIQTHITEETFVKTNLISEGLQKLNENGIVILTGIPGIGKSRNSLELLRAFSTENQGYSAIWLPKRSEWSELINADDKLIVLIDDVFGRTNNTFDGNEDLKLLDIIYSTIQRGTVKVTLTMRNTIKLGLSDVGDSHRMFKDVNFLDISSDRLQMTTDEKKACLLNLCKKNNIWESKSCTKELNSDDIAILNPEVPVYLSGKQIGGIVKINVCPLLGFPESCYLFTSNRKFTWQGVAFFKHPSQALCDEISNIRTSGKHDDCKALEYVILVYIMLNGDCFDPYKINCEKAKQIIESIYDPSSIKLTTIKMKNCVESLMGRYLKLTEDKTVCFQHRTIFESVLLSYKDVDPELVIPLLDKDCLLELGCLENYKPRSGEVTFKFYSESYKQLASQLVTYLKLACDLDDFVKTLCSSRIIRYADKSMLEELHNANKNGKLGDVYIRRRWLMRSKYKYIHYGIEDVPFTLLSAMLQYSINFTDNTNVITEILDLVSKEMNVCPAICVKERYSCCFTHALLQTCASNDIARLNAILNFMKTKHIKLDEQVILCSLDSRKIQENAFKVLLAHVKDCELIDVFVLMKVVVALDDVSLVYFIIEQYNCKSYNIQSVMNLACRKGAVNIVRWFYEHFDISVFNMQSLMLTVRDYGNTEIVKLLLDKLDQKTLDLDAAMNTSMKDNFNNTYVPLIMNSIKNRSFQNYSYPSMIRGTSDIRLFKYLLETYSISNFDLKVVIEIAGLTGNSDILQLVLQKVDINDFYQIWIKAEKFVNHSTMILEHLFKSGCCTDKDVLTLMNTELRHDNFHGIKYLMETFDWKYFDINTVINYFLSSFQHSKIGETYDDLMIYFSWHYTCCFDLMFWMLKTFDYNHLNMYSILKKAYAYRAWDVVDWIWKNIDMKMFNIIFVVQSVVKYSELSWMFKNFDHSLLDLQSTMTSACSYDNISLVRSMINRFGIKRFQSRHIMQFAVRNLSNGCSHIVKLCLNNSINIGEYNMIAIFNQACRHNIVELIEWLLVHYDHVHFHFNSAFTETLKMCSNRSWYLKRLLVKFGHTFLDIEWIIQHCCREGMFDIVMWMLNTFDPHLVDIRPIMSMACQNGKLNLVQCIIRQYGIRMFNIESIFDDACQSKSSSILEWLYQNFENSHICNLNNYSYESIIFLVENRKINSSNCNIILNYLCKILDGKTYIEFLKRLLDTTEHRLIDLKLVFNHACRYDRSNFVKLMMCVVDQTLLDFQSAILEAVKYDNFYIVTYLLKMKGVKTHNFDVNYVFLKACQYTNVQLINLLLGNFENRMFNVSEGISHSCSTFGVKTLIKNLIERCHHNLIDFNIVIQAACRSHVSFTLKKLLMEIADTSKVDAPFIMHLACNCSSPDWDFVKFMFTIYDYKIFDMKLIFNSVCRTGTLEKVKWLLDHYDRSVFDLKSGFNEACCEYKLDIVKLLVESVGPENFDLQPAIQLIMNKKEFPYNRYEKIVKYLFNNMQPSVSDLQCVMDKMCPTGNTVFVKWLIKSFDYSKLDLNSTISTMFDQRYYYSNVLELLLQSFDHERFDMMLIIILANHNGYRELVSMMIKTVYHSFFDMKTVLLEICKGGDLQTVKYLIETFHYEDLVDETFILNAFRTGSSDIVKWLLRKREGEIIDTKTAMSNACIGGHTQLVQYLLVKYNVKHFDLRSYINVASYYGRTEVVQYFLQVFHYERFDMDSVMYHARASGHISLVKWLLGVYDHEIFNIESSVIEDVKNEMAEFQKKKKKKLSIYSCSY